MALKLYVRHEFACTPAQYWDAFWDPALDALIQSRAGVVRKLTAERTEGNVRYQRFTYIPNKPLPAAAAKVLGTDRLTYDQENHFDLSNPSLRWKVIPMVMGDKIRAEGTSVAQATSTGCERRIDGVIEVRIPLFGGKIEQAILEEVLKSYENAASATRDFIAGRLRA